MKKAAVATISFFDFDNEILQVIVDVDDNATWKEAYVKAMNEGLMGQDNNQDPDRDGWIMGLPDDLTEARTELGNGEMDLCVTFAG